VVARRRAARLAIVTHQLWAALQLEISNEQIKLLVREWLSAALDRDELHRTKADFAADFAAHNDMPRSEAASYLIGSDAEGEFPWRQQALKDADWQEARPIANALIRDHALSLSEDSDAYRQLCLKLARAMAEYHITCVQRSLNDWAYNPLGPAGALPPLSSTGPKFTGKPLGEVAASFLDEKIRVERPDYSREKKLRRALQLFADWVGKETPVDAIDRRRLGEFRSALTKIPARHEKRFPSMPLSRVIEEATAASLSPIDVQTANTHLAIVSSMFDWCETGGLVRENPARGVRVTSGGEINTYEPFKPVHLEKIFRSPVFTGCKSKGRVFELGSYQLRNWKYWLPLMGLFTGARIEELCQLHATDVAEIDGVWCFMLTDEGGRSIKTDAGKRIVPVHPELARLGFLDLVRHRQTSGAAMFLPEGPSPVKGDWGHYPSRWFGTLLLRTLGAEEKGHRKLVFHSFRHTMKDAMREAEIEERTQDRLLGHANSHPGERYGKGLKPPQLFSAIKRVKFPVDLSHLAPWRPPSRE